MVYETDAAVKHGTGKVIHQQYVAASSDMEERPWEPHVAEGLHKFFNAVIIDKTGSLDLHPESVSSGKGRIIKNIHNQTLYPYPGQPPDKAVS